MHYLALGDSYTIGEGVEPGARWPAQLAMRLRDQACAVETPHVIATTGWTTDELSAAMDAAEPIRAPGGHPWDLVTLLIGVNNQYRGRDVANYRDEFSALLDRAIALAGGKAAHVVVVSIPDWGVTPFARQHGADAAHVASALDEYNAEARSVASARGAAFVDITDISRAHGHESSMLADDGLHPSAAMYTLWTQRILPVACQALAA